ncbi:MAG: rhomboid family intramembrane serine protease [Moraxellaceae bacterium]|nr:MAG: rhomboid family intramembrane serine protease [Moraxellaceae bacterium]
MNWIVVKKFPLTTDLTHVTGFLRERAIQHHIYEEAGEQVLAVADSRMVAPIAQFLDDVAQGRLVISQEENVQPQVEESSAASLIDQLKTTPISALLILLSALGALLVAMDSERNIIRWFTFQDMYQYSFLPLSESLQTGQIWRFITPAFLHFGFLHVLFNSLWMWDLGRRLELLLGKRNFILFFLFTAAVSNAAQYRWAADTLFGGMSGVVYGLVGFIIVSHKISPHKLTAVPASILGFMLFWLVLCMTGVIDYFVGGGVANAAHIGGLLAGAAFAAVTVKKVN